MKHLLVPALSVLTIAAASCGSNTVRGCQKKATLRCRIMTAKYGSKI